MRWSALTKTQSSLNLVTESGIQDIETVGQKPAVFFNYKLNNKQIKLLSVKWN